MLKGLLVSPVQCGYLGLKYGGMNLISMMELNARSSYVWDWENLVMLNSKSTNEVPKRLHKVDSGFEVVEEGFEVGTTYYLEGRSVGGAGGVSTSDLGFRSSSKSSKSASVDSLTNLEIKESRFLSETKDDTPELSFKKELHNALSGGISSMTQASSNPGEWMLDLELGKRTYFEDVSASTSEKIAAVVSVCPAVTTRRSKSSSKVVVISQCQVEGCNLDLSSAKDYYRKHRVCETHSKSPKVIVGGLERRFCQQCSRFHSMSEFDQTKRSCRKRLSDHNARRHKPKPKMMHFDSIRPPSSLYAGRHQMSIAFDQVPWPVHTRMDGDIAKNAQERQRLFISSKPGAMDDALLDPGTELSPDSQQVLSPKGFQARLSSSSMDAAAAHNLRALSLLSSNSWGSCEPELGPLSVIKPSQAPTAGNGSLLPTASSAYWHGGPSIFDRDHRHQQFQLFKDPQERSFYSD